MIGSQKGVGVPLRFEITTDVERILQAAVDRFAEAVRPELDRIAAALEHTDHAVLNAASVRTDPLAHVPVREVGCASIPVVWTADRVNALLAMADEGLPLKDRFEILNAMPGAPIASVGAMAVKMAKLHKERALPAPSESPATPGGRESVAVKTENTSDLKTPLPAAEVRSASPNAVAILPASKPVHQLPAVLAPLTGEQKAVFKAMWERGDEAEAIARMLNEIDGPKQTAATIIRKAAALGYLRKPVEAPPDDVAGSVSIEQVRAWFEKAGGNPAVVPTPQRLLKAANLLRAHLKLAPFEVIWVVA